MVNLVLEIKGKKHKSCQTMVIHEMVLTTVCCLHLLALERSRLEPVMLQGIKDGGATREILQEVEWRQVACGGFHTVAVTPNGDLCTWGCGARGRLGHGDEVDVNTPKQVVTGSFIGKEVVHVACGSNHTAVVTSEGELHTWYVSSILSCHVSALTLKLMLRCSAT